MNDPLKTSTTGQNALGEASGSEVSEDAPPRLIFNNYNYHHLSINENQVVQTNRSPLPTDTIPLFDSESYKTKITAQSMNETIFKNNELNGNAQMITSREVSQQSIRMMPTNVQSTLSSNEQQKSNGFLPPMTFPVKLLQAPHHTYFESTNEMENGKSGRQTAPHQNIQSHHSIEKNLSTQFGNPGDEANNLSTCKLNATKMMRKKRLASFEISGEGPTVRQHLLQQHLQQSQNMSLKKMTAESNPIEMNRHSLILSSLTKMPPIRKSLPMPLPQPSISPNMDEAPYAISPPATYEINRTVRKYTKTKDGNFSMISSESGPMIAPSHQSPSLSQPPAAFVQTSNSRLPKHGTPVVVAGGNTIVARVVTTSDKSIIVPTNPVKVRGRKLESTRDLKLYSSVPPRANKGNASVVKEYSNEPNPFLMTPKRDSSVPVKPQNNVQNECDPTKKRGRRQNVRFDPLDRTDIPVQDIVNQKVLEIKEAIGLQQKKNQELIDKQKASEMGILSMMESNSCSYRVLNQKSSSICLDQTRAMQNFSTSSTAPTFLSNSVAGQTSNSFQKRLISNSNADEGRFQTTTKAFVVSKLKNDQISSPSSSPPGLCLQQSNPGSPMMTTLFGSPISSPSSIEMSNIPKMPSDYHEAIGKRTEAEFKLRLSESRIEESIESVINIYGRGISTPIPLPTVFIQPTKRTYQRRPRKPRQNTPKTTAQSAVQSINGSSVNDSTAIQSINSSVNDSTAIQSINGSVNDSTAIQSINGSVNDSAAIQSINGSVNDSAAIQSINGSVNDSTAIQSINGSVNDSAAIQSINGSVNDSAAIQSINGSVNYSAAIQSINGSVKDSTTIQSINGSVNDSAAIQSINGSVKDSTTIQSINGSVNDSAAIQSINGSVIKPDLIGSQLVNVKSLEETKLQDVEIPPLPTPSTSETKTLTDLHPQPSCEIVYPSTEEKDASKTTVQPTFIVPQLLKNKERRKNIVFKVPKSKQRRFKLMSNKVAKCSNSAQLFQRFNKGVATGWTVKKIYVETIRMKKKMQHSMRRLKSKSFSTSQKLEDEEASPALTTSNSKSTNFSRLDTISSDIGSSSSGPSLQASPSEAGQVSTEAITSQNPLPLFEQMKNEAPKKKLQMRKVPVLELELYSPKNFDNDSHCNVCKIRRAVVLKKMFENNDEKHSAKRPKKVQNKRRRKSRQFLDRILPKYRGPMTLFIKGVHMRHERLMSTFVKAACEKFTLNSDEADEALNLIGSMLFGKCFNNCNVKKLKSGDDSNIDLPANGEMIKTYVNQIVPVESLEIVDEINNNSEKEKKKSTNPQPSPINSHEFSHSLSSSIFSQQEINDTLNNNNGDGVLMNEASGETLLSSVENQASNETNLTLFNLSTEIDLNQLLEANDESLDDIIVDSSFADVSLETLFNDAETLIGTEDDKKSTNTVKQMDLFHWIEKSGDGDMPVDEDEFSDMFTEGADSLSHIDKDLSETFGYDSSLMKCAFDDNGLAIIPNSEENSSNFVPPLNAVIPSSTPNISEQMTRSITTELQASNVSDASIKVGNNKSSIGLADEKPLIPNTKLLTGPKRAEQKLSEKINVPKTQENHVVRLYTPRPGVQKTEIVFSSLELQKRSEERQKLIEWLLDVYEEHLEKFRRMEPNARKLKVEEARLELFDKKCWNRFENFINVNRFKNFCYPNTFIINGMLRPGHHHLTSLHAKRIVARRVFHCYHKFVGQLKNVLKRRDEQNLPINGEFQLSGSSNPDKQLVKEAEWRHLKTIDCGIPEFLWNRSEQLFQICTMIAMTRDEKSKIYQLLAQPHDESVKIETVDESPSTEVDLDIGEETTDDSNETSMTPLPTSLIDDTEIIKQKQKSKKRDMRNFDPITDSSFCPSELSPVLSRSERARAREQAKHRLTKPAATSAPEGDIASTVPDITITPPTPPPSTNQNADKVDIREPELTKQFLLVPEASPFSHQQQLTTNAAPNNRLKVKRSRKSIKTTIDIGNEDESNGLKTSLRPLIGENVKNAIFKKLNKNAAEKMKKNQTETEIITQNSVKPVVSNDQNDVKKLEEAVSDEQVIKKRKKRARKIKEAEKIKKSEEVEQQIDEAMSETNNEVEQQLTKEELKTEKVEPTVIAKIKCGRGKWSREEKRKEKAEKEAARLAEIAKNEKLHPKNSAESSQTKRRRRGSRIVEEIKNDETSINLGEIETSSEKPIKKRERRGAAKVGIERAASKPSVTNGRRILKRCSEQAVTASSLVTPKSRKILRRKRNI